MDYSSIPFRIDEELYHKLNHNTSPYLDSQGHSNGKTTPWVADGFVPGQPQLSLAGTELPAFLRKELSTPDLDKIAPHLWLVAKEDSSHISSLTHQLVRGRQVVITEDPQLHLVWIDDRIFLKPLPKYLLSHAFWRLFLEEKFPQPNKENEYRRQTLERAARGFIRSYAHLIQHRSDFDIAIERRLVPRKMKFKDLVRFLQTCQNNIPDKAVSPRYLFGELRLTRLNFWSKILLRRFYFHKVHGQYGAYFARYYGPLFFVFAIFSLMLNSAQVVLSAGTALDPTSVQSFSTTFALASKVLSLLTLAGLGLIVAHLLILLVTLVSREVIFALRHHNKRYAQRSSHHIS